MKRKLTLLISALYVTPSFAETFSTTIDAATYISSGTITFDDHGYIGPTGVGANDFQVTSTVTGITGFDASRVGQIQNVVTKDPDWKTSDPAHDVLGDLFSKATYDNANMDASVNFFKWGYTTVGGSTFNNMTIDKAGNYYIARNDMSFQYYDVFQYNNGTDPIQTVDTQINFQPYALSDAKGWCGSVLTTDPNSLERMAGQVSFDFAFDVYFEMVPGATPSFSSTEIVPDFVMRSYGSYVVDVTTNGGVNQHFIGSAVENNTNPETGLLDPDWQNQVSFLGAGVIPKGVWVFGDATANVTVAEDQGVAGMLNGETRADGATWHANSFAGYAFLLRADGTRELFYINPEGFSDYAAAVPEPETYAMMLAGVGLVGGMAARRRRQMA
jgi:hypothetical protein